MASERRKSNLYSDDIFDDIKFIIIFFVKQYSEWNERETTERSLMEIAKRCIKLKIYDFILKIINLHS